MNKSEPAHLLHLSRCMVHGVHAIFPPSEITQHGGGVSVSENKLYKGDETWEYEKEIIGWIFNGQYYTLRLTADKIKKSSNSYTTSRSP